MKTILIFLFALSTFFAKGQSTFRVEAEDFDAESGTQIVGSVWGFVSVGDWGMWTIDFGAYTYYKVDLRVSCPNTGETAEFRLGSVGGTLLATIPIPNTGGFGTFTTITTYIAVPTGTSNLYYVSLGPDYGPDVDWFDFTPIPTPVANAGADLVKFGVVQGNFGSQSVTGTAFDEGSIVSVVWRQLTGPNTATIVSGNTLTPNMTNMATGVHTFELAVTDNESNVGRDTVAITVRYCEGGTGYTLLNPSGGNFFYTSPGYTARTYSYDHIVYGYPTLTVLPGDTLKLREGWVNRAAIGELFGIDGSPGCPIHITAEGNNDDTAFITEKFLLRDCNYIEISGRPYGNTDTARLTGNESFRIRMGGDWGIALGIIGRSSNLLVDWLYQKNVSYASHVKTDPQDLGGYADSLGYAWPHAPNLANIELKYIYTINFRQDGHYLGSTDPTGLGRTYSWSGGPEVYIRPQALENINIHHCTLENGMRTGIQLSGAIYGENKIERNIIKNVGLEFNTQQGTCVSLGMSSNTFVRYNECRVSFIYNFFDIGAGKNYWIGNWSDSAGYMYNHLDSGMWDAHYPHLDRATALADLVTAGVVTIDGDVIKNVENNQMASMALTTKPTWPHMTKSVVVQDNIFGAQASTVNSGGPVIAFRDYGPAWDWDEDNVVCNNVGSLITREDMDHDNSVGTAEIQWPLYSTECIIYDYKHRLPRGRRIKH